MTKRLKMVKGSGNVFRDLGFSAEEAQNLRLRSELMIEIEDFVKASGLTQKEAAKRLGAPSRVSTTCCAVRSANSAWMRW